jgi:hypothetical protein
MATRVKLGATGAGLLAVTLDLLASTVITGAGDSAAFVGFLLIRRVYVLLKGRVSVARTCSLGA